MKKFLSLILIVATTLSVVFVAAYPQRVQAQEGVHSTSLGGDLWNTGKNLLKNPFTTIGSGLSEVAGLGTAKLAEAVGLDAASIKAGVLEAAKSAMAWVVQVAIALAAWVLTFAGFMLDATLQWTIYDMGARLSDKTETGKIIESTWKTIRDFCNIIFIFTLLYIAINTILQRNSYASKKLISTLIIAAILINYSFFFTKLLIDVSNVFTIRFYTAIQTADQKVKLPANTNPNGGNIGAAELEKLAPTEGLGAVYMNRLGLVKIYTDSTKIDGFNIIIAGIMGTLFILCAAFVFAVIAGLFIVRYVILLFLLIFSPVMFVSSVLPALKPYNDMWWKKLNSELLFGPAFMMITWVSLHLGGGISVTESDPLSLGFNFIVIGAFMVASVIIAKKVGAVGGDTMLNWGKEGGGLVGRGFVRTGVRTATGTIALANNTLARTPLLNRVFTNKSAGSISAEELNKRFSRTWVGNTMAGEAIVKGTTGALVNNKFGSSRSIAETTKKQESLNKAYQGIKAEKADAAKFSDKKALLTAAIKSSDASKISAELNKFSDKDIVALSKSNPEFFNNPLVLQNLKSSQFDALVDDKNENLDINTRKDLKGTRKGQLDTSVTALEAKQKALADKIAAGASDDEKKAARKAQDDAQKAVDDIIRLRSPKEIAAGSTDTLKKISRTGFMNKQIKDAIDKREDLTAQEITDAKFAKENAIFKAYASSVASGSSATQAQKDQAKYDMERAMADLSAKEFASMDRTHHTNKAVMAMATSDQYSELMKANQITGADKENITQARFGTMFTDMDTLDDTTAFNALSAPDKAEMLKRADTNVGKLTSSEIAHIAAQKTELLGNTEFISRIKPKALEDVHKNNDIIGSHKDKIKETRIAPLLTAQDNNNATEVAKLVKKNLDPKSFGTIKEEKLITTGGLPSLILMNANSQMLNEVRTDHSKAAAIRAAIENTSTPQTPNIVKLKNWLRSNKGNDFGV